MKTKTTLIAVLFAATGTTFASGLSIDSVDVSKTQPTKAEITEIKPQGPIDAFKVKVESKQQADTRQLKQSYDGRS